MSVELSCDIFPFDLNARHELVYPEGKEAIKPAHIGKQEWEAFQTCMKKLYYNRDSVKWIQYFRAIVGARRKIINGRQQYIMDRAKATPDWGAEDRALKVLLDEAHIKVETALKAYERSKTPDDADRARMKYVQELQGAPEDRGTDIKEYTD